VCLLEHTRTPTHFDLVAAPRLGAALARCGPFHWTSGGEWPTDSGLGLGGQGNAVDKPINAHNGHIMGIMGGNGHNGR
jgi:hypothetical protein